MQIKYKFRDWSMPEDTANDFWQTLKSLLIIYQVLFQHYITKLKIIYHLVPIQGIKLQLCMVNSSFTEYHCQNPFLSAVQANLYLKKCLITRKYDRTLRVKNFKVGHKFSYFSQEDL